MKELTAISGSDGSVLFRRHRDRTWFEWENEHLAQTLPNDQSKSLELLLSDDYPEQGVPSFAGFRHLLAASRVRLTRRPSGSAHGE